MAFRKLGYDPDVLGFERIHNITKRIRRAAQTPEGIRGVTKTRMRISGENFKNADLEKMSQKEVSKRMQHEIVYLQQQMAFLKKLMSLDKENEPERRSWAKPERNTRSSGTF